MAISARAANNPNETIHFTNRTRIISSSAMKALMNTL